MILAQNETMSYTATIPVFFVDTENSAPVIRKDTTLSACFRLETNGWKNYESIGSVDNPLTGEIKCRGNWTFTNFEKKPYKIKLSEKTELLGMPKNKHWVLIAHPDDRTRFLRNSIGFEVSRMLGMKYTPKERPVELVLNGEYLGLYMLTEHIRVGKNRVDIEEQLNGETDYEKISNGGWLVEIDNYVRDNQIEINVPDKNVKELRFTYHSPDSLSDIQADFLKNEIENIITSIYNSDKSSLHFSNYVDVDELVRYCINTEVTAHEETYFGSTFLYKSGEGKFLFGPVWDFGNSILSCWKKSFTWEPDKNLFGYNIMTEISKFPDFQERIRDIWPSFYRDAYKLDLFIDSLVSDIAVAADQDAKRWPQYVYETYGTSTREKSVGVKRTLKDKIEWLNSQWGAEEEEETLVVPDKMQVDLTLENINSKGYLNSNVLENATVWESVTFNNYPVLGKSLVLSNGRSVTVTVQGARSFEVILKNPYDGYDYFIQVGDNAKAKLIHQGTIDGYCSDERSSGLIACPAEQTTITITGGEKPIHLGCIIFYKQPVETEITSAGYATYSNAGAVKIPEGLKAYYVRDADDIRATIVEVLDGIIPANTGVILEGLSGKYPMEGIVTSKNYQNKLVANLTNAGTFYYETFNGGNGYFTLAAGPCFRLSSGYVAGEDYSFLSSGKAFLPRSENMSNSSNLNLDFISTGIDVLTIPRKDKSDPVYNISGNRMTSRNKGVHIRNHKKYMSK